MIGIAATAAGIHFDIVRHGSSHDVYRCGGTMLSIPRHNEINEHTARGIMTDLAGELGEKWWQ